MVAPATVQHPPDYDPKPSDLAAVTDADYILFAEFDGFAPRLKEAPAAPASSSPSSWRTPPTQSGQR